MLTQQQNQTVCYKSYSLEGSGQLPLSTHFDNLLTRVFSYILSLVAVALVPEV